MYSILIVDDEEPVLESYTYMIRNGDLDLEVCGAARSGSEAITLARESRPDIVVMDIAMPGMDGLDTIRELRKMYPDALYILSTAYERFDLAQRAIPLRVFEYLVKPVSRRRFLETMIHATEVLEKRRKDVTPGEVGRDEEDFLLLLTWKTFDPQEWNRYREMLRFSSDFGRVLVIALDYVPESQSREEARARITGKLERRFRIFFTDHMGYLLLFIPETTDTEEGLDRYVRESIRPLATENLRFRVGLGDRRQYNELYLSYEHALQEIARVAGDPEQEEDRFFLQMRYLVARAHADGDLCERCREQCEREFVRLPFPVARSRMIVLFTLLLEDLAVRSGREQADLLLRRIGDPARAITAIENRRDWDAWAGRALRLLLEYSTKLSLDRYPAPLRSAIAYIDSEFQREINLKSLAEYCSVSSGYLSRLFSEHLNTTFNDYLNNTRIEAAEHYLVEGKLSVKEIAYRTGYNDPNYFSRIFKKYKGLSPTSYLSRKGAHAE